MKKVKLNLDQITPGMKLAEPITNSNGITLMPAGIRLTPMFIARIKKWNIEALDVIEEKQQDVDTLAARPVPAAGPLKGPGGDTAVSGVKAGGRTLTAEEEEFARGIVRDISASFINLRDNELMMQLRAVAIKRLIQHGPRGPVNLLRLAIPAEGDSASAKGGGNGA